MNYVFMFDLDGTIVITDEIYYEIWKKILLDYNIHLNKELYNKYIYGNSDTEVCNNLGINYSINLSENKDLYFSEYIHLIKVIPGFYDFIKKIHFSGYKICIVTNCNRITAELIINHINITNYISFIVIGSECNNPKPYPDPYIYAYNKFKDLIGVDIKSIIFEDSKTGILSAKGSSPMCLVGITTLYNKEDLLHYVDLVFDNYENIDISVLLNYNKNIMDENRLIKYIKKSLKLNEDKIKIFTDKLKGGFISDIIKLEFVKNDKIKNAVIKLENKNDNFLSKMACDLELYNREYYFYENVSKYVPIKIPIFYGLLKNNDYENIGIILENLFSKGFSQNLNLNIESIDISLKIIDQLARLHSEFWNKDLKKIFNGLKKNNEFSFKWNDFIKEKYPIFCNKWNFLKKSHIEIFDKIIKNFDNIENELSSGNLTLCHGDVKSANMFFDNEKNPIFIDWQYLLIGKGTQDLVFFMIESFDETTIKKYYKLFIDYYYVKLQEYSVNNYTKEEYLIDIKNSTMYFPFFVMIWFGTVSSDELIDKNFPYFFIKKYINFLELNIK